MAACTVTRRIAAPRERVFAALTDLDGAADRFTSIRAIERLTPGPFAVGTRWRETRVVMGKEATEAMEVVALDAPSGYTVRSDAFGCEFLTRFALVPEGDATLLSMTLEPRPRGGVAKVFAFLLRPMLRACAKAFEKDLDDLAGSLGPGERRSHASS